MNVPQSISTRKVSAIMGCIIIIMASVFGALYVTKAIYPSATTEVWVLPPFTEASYTVVQYNSTAWAAKNQTTGNYDYVSTSGDDTVNYALSSLTAGRTWKEKVKLIGTFDTANPFTVYSNTILELQGKVFQIASANCHMIQADPCSTDIDIFGGEWDGNQAFQSGPASAFELTNCTRVNVKGCYIHDVYQYGAISFADSQDCSATDNTIINCGNKLIRYCDGIFAQGHATITNNIIRNVSDTAIVSEWDTPFGYTGQKTIISNNQIEDCLCGIQAYWGPQAISITNNQIHNTDQYPIKLCQNQYASSRQTEDVIIISNTINTSLTEPGVTLWNCSNFDVSHNIITNTALDGIELKESSYGTISHNTMIGMGTSGIDIVGINDHACHDITVDGNVISDIQGGAGIVLQDDLSTYSHCSSITVSNNIVSNSTLNGAITGLGISLARAQTCIVSDNHVWNCSDVGIDLYQTLACLVQDNFAYGNTLYDFRLNTGSNYTKIHGNSFDKAFYGDASNVGTNGGLYSDVSTASYIIYTDGTYTYCRNGTSGLVIEQSTSSYAVLTNAIGNASALSSGNARGGSVFLQDGTFDIYSTLVIPYPGKVHVFGVSSAATILEQHTSGINVLNITGNGDSSSAYSKSADQVELDHLQLRGGTGYGIYCNDTQNLWIHDVAVRYTGYYMFVDHCQYATFQHIIGQNSKYGGVRLFSSSGWSGHYLFERCEFDAKAANAFCFEIFENGQHLDRVTLNSLQLWADTSYTNTIGIWIHGVTPSNVAITGLEVLGSTNIENCDNAILIESAFRSIVFETPDFYGGSSAHTGINITATCTAGTLTLRQPHFNTMSYGIFSYGTCKIVMTDPIWVAIATEEIAGTTTIYDLSGYKYDPNTGVVVFGDLLHGVTPTQSTWSYWNNDEAYTSDDNFDTYGYGYNNLTTSGATIGLLTWDLGANYTVLFGETCGVWSNTSSVNCLCSWSYDNNTFYTSSNTDFAKTSTTLTFTAGQSVLVYARYIQIKFTTGAANESANVRIYEVHAIVQPNS